MFWKTVLLTLFMAFQMYGVKVWFVDAIVVSSALMLLVVSTYPRLSRFQLSWIALILLYFIYVVSAQLLTATIDFYIVGRYLRVILSALFLAVIVNEIQPGRRRIKAIVGNLLLLHGLAIVMQMIVPELKQYMAPVVAFPKDVAMLRAFGLVGSYDMASLYLCVGMIIFLSRYVEERKNRFILALLFLWISGWFTGRTFMVTGTVILIGSVTTIIWLSAWKTKIWVATCSIGALLLFWVTFGPLLLASMGLMDVESQALPSNLQIGGSYYLGTLDVMKRYIILPSNPFHLLLGGLGDPLSDNGYVRLIYTTGVIGLLWLVFAYLYLASAVWSSRVTDRWVVVATVVLILIYNVKLFMVGARGITELMLLLAYSAHADRTGRLGESRQMAFKLADS